jgi:hypothetical protein
MLFLNIAQKQDNRSGKIVSFIYKLLLVFHINYRPCGFDENLGGVCKTFIL